MPTVRWRTPAEGEGVAERVDRVVLQMGAFIYVNGIRRGSKLTEKSKLERIDERTVRLAITDEEEVEMEFEDAAGAEEVVQIFNNRWAKTRRPVAGELRSPPPNRAAGGASEAASSAGSRPPRPRPSDFGDDDIAQAAKSNRLSNRRGGFLPGSSISAEQKGWRPPPVPVGRPPEGPSAAAAALAANMAGSPPRPPPASAAASRLDAVSPEKGSRRAPQAPSWGARDDGQQDEKRRRLDGMIAPPGAGTPEKWRPGASGPPPQRAPVQVRSSLLTLGRHMSSAAYRAYRSVETFGLRNLGNTCYLNAVMQALCSLREFVADLRAMPSSVPNCADGELFKCTVDILQQMSAQGGTNGPLSPAKLRQRIAVACPMFGRNEQQDAHEFLLEYVNQLHDELLGARARWLTESGLDEASAADAGVLATHLHLDSEVHKRLECINCRRVRTLRELFRDFSIDFDSEAKNDSCQLVSMVKAYFAEELLDTKCEGCGAPASRMEKYLAPHPRTLVLHLKRFVPNIERQRYDKRHQSVEIPQRFNLRSGVQVLDAAPGAASTSAVAGSPAPAHKPAAVGGAAAEDRPGGPPATPPRMPARPLASRNSDPLPPPPLPPPPGPPPPLDEVMPQGPPLWYSLRAVVAHDGASPHSGHYVCYARGEGGTWRLYDDSAVTEFGTGFQIHQELGRKAYILFYVQE